MQSKSFLTRTKLGDVGARQSPSSRIPSRAIRKKLLLGDIESGGPSKLHHVHHSRSKGLSGFFLKSSSDIKHVGGVDLSGVNEVHITGGRFDFSGLITGFELDLDISVAVNDGRGVGSSGDRESNGVGGQGSVELGDKAGPGVLDLILNLVLGGVGLGRSHGGDVDNEIVGVEGEVQLNVVFNSLPFWVFSGCVLFFLFFCFAVGVSGDLFLLFLDCLKPTPQ